MPEKTYRIECTDADGNRRVIKTDDAEYAESTRLYWELAPWASNVTLDERRAQ